MKKAFFKKAKSAVDQGEGHKSARERYTRADHERLQGRNVARPQGHKMRRRRNSRLVPGPLTSILLMIGNVTCDQPR